MGSRTRDHVKLRTASSGDAFIHFTYNSAKLPPTSDVHKVILDKPRADFLVTPKKRAL